jgi:hypothetical protein
MGYMGHGTNAPSGRQRSALDRVLLAVVIFLPLAFLTMSIISSYGLLGFGRPATVLVKTDFTTYWAASRMVIEGRVADLYNYPVFLAEQKRLLGPAAPGHPYVYPPHSLLLIAPLGLVAYGWSLAVWQLAGLAAYLGVTLAGAWRWSTAAVLMLAPASLANAMFGQAGFITAALLISGVRLMDRAPVAAGILFGALTFKPHLGLLVPVALVAAQAWRTIAAAAITSVSLALLSAALFGASLWPDWIRHISSFSQTIVTHDVSIADYFGVSPMMAARQHGLGFWAGLGVQALFSLAGGLAVWYSFRRPRSKPLAFAVLAVATPLAIPHALVYDLVTVQVAVLLAYGIAEREGFLLGESAALALCWMAPVIVIALTPLGWPVGPVVLTALLLYLLARVHQSSGDGAQWLHLSR